jgi:hypothetical protein
MINKKNKLPQNRKHYIKPKVEQVKLVAEEAVLASCKAPSAGAGPGGKNNCRVKGVPCVTETS